MAKEISSTEALKERALKEEERFAELVRESDIIFIGTVKELGPAPSFWSGRFPTYQTVKYDVSEVVKGNAISEITVSHIVVSNSKTARRDEPGLSPAIFQKGAQLIVIAVKSDQGEWKSLDENMGALPHSEETLKKIESLARK